MHGRRKRNRRDASPITDFLPFPSSLYKIHLTSAFLLSLSLFLLKSTQGSPFVPSRLFDRFAKRIIAVHSFSRTCRFTTLMQCPPPFKGWTTYPSSRLLLRDTTRIPIVFGRQRHIHRRGREKGIPVTPRFGWEFELMVGDISSVLF